MNYRKLILFSLLFVSTKLNAAMNFPTTGYVELNTNLSKIETTTFTVTCWVKLNAAQVSRQFLCCAGPSGATSGYGLGVDDTTNNKIKFYTANANGSFAHNLVSNRAIETSTWTHIAFVYKTAPSGTNKWLYINAVLDNSAATTVPIGYTSAKCALGVWIANWAQYLNGQLDDVRYYPRALSHNEIRSLAFGRGRNPCAIDDCNAYWRLDEGPPGLVTSTITALSVRDFSGNGVHGTPRNITQPNYTGSILQYPYEGGF